MEKIIRLLNHHPQVDEWKIVSAQRESRELFFIKDQLEMNRAKNIHHIIVTLYKVFIENDKKYKGSATVKLNISDSIENISKRIDEGIFAASFVKNAYYPLPLQDIEVKEKPIIKDDLDLVQEITKAVKAVYNHKVSSNAFINSSEFFITTSDVHITNSNGLDVTYQHQACTIELVTEANGKEESTEIIDTITSGTFNHEYLQEKIEEQLKLTDLRQQAIPMPDIKDIPVIIRGENLFKFWDYFLFKISAGQKYGHLHQNDIGTHLQGEDSTGDLITCWIKPYLPNSSNNSPYDTDGYPLKDYLMIEKGVCKRLLATYRYAYYLDIKPTGEYRNIVIDGGSCETSEIQNKPYLEVIAFSSFQTDVMTGSFGGEFRLGIYFDGKNKIPVTLGTVTGKIPIEQKTMLLSREVKAYDKFIGPKFVVFKSMNIVGNNKV